MKEENLTIIVRLRGNGETMKDAKRRKKLLEKVAKIEKCSEAQVVREMIDMEMVQ